MSRDKSQPTLTSCLPSPLPPQGTSSWSPQPTFRHEEYIDYKANRESQPEEITAAFPYIHEVIKGFKIPIITINYVYLCKLPKENECDKGPIVNADELEINQGDNDNHADIALASIMVLIPVASCLFN